MFKKRKGLKITTLILLLVTFAFVRFDIPQETLEIKYFTNTSHYLNATITTLEGDEITAKIHYQDWGNMDDEVIILLHGAFSSSHTFDSWADRLVNSGYRVIAMDLPYFGLSSGFDDQITSYRRSAEVLHFLVSTLGINTFHLAGNSLGGAVAWYYTAVHGEYVSSLLLLDAIYPSIISPNETEKSWILSIPLVTDFLATLSPKFMLKSILESAYADPSLLNSMVVDRYYDLLLREGTRKSILTSISEPLSQEEAELLLLDIEAPVYLMWGQEDTWIPVEYAYDFIELLSIPNNRIFIYPNLGHVPMEENPISTFSDYLSLLEGE